MRSRAADSMRSSNCFFCRSTGNPGSLGQFTFRTVAIQEPRSSRAGGGGRF